MGELAVARPSHEQPLQVVVTCANRKTQEVPASLRLGSFNQRYPATRFTAWTARLDANSHPRYRALDLYAGEHWQVVRSLAGDAALGPNAVLWVASAGYGLIPADALICAYGATFSTGRDTVGATAGEVADWWRRLGDWPGPVLDQPRTFTDLARRTPGATIIAVLSEAYQRACAEDLLSAATLVSPDALSVVGPRDAHPALTELLVPVSAPLQHAVGGSLQALNVRVLRHLIAHGVESGRAALREAILAVAPPEPPVRQPTGQRMSDAEVYAYIRANPQASATKLLRQLRNTGRSCEQARFGRLHAQVCRQGHNL